jgi:hypothetical protein
VATKKALVKPRGKKVHRPTKVHLREMTGLTYILIPDKKELEVPKNINEISMYGFSCREELTREIMDNMSNEFVNNSVMAFAATYEKWENNKAISKPVMSEKELRDFTGLMDIFVGGIGSGIAPLEFLEACGPRQISHQWPTPTAIATARMPHQRGVSRRAPSNPSSLSPRAKRSSR